MWLLGIIKRINRFFANIINFFIIGIIYFVGGLFSYLLYLASRKQEKKTTYWHIEHPKEDDFRRQI